MYKYGHAPRTYLSNLEDIYIYNIGIYGNPPKDLPFEVHSGGCRILALIGLTFLQDHIAWCHIFSIS